MQPWFIWKGKNSYSDYGLWINKLPPIVRASERYQEITVPGRAGTLLMTEGDDVYDSYLKECVVLLPNTHNLQPILAWLRGSGDVVFSNEADFAYEARIAGEVSFERVDNNLMQATIPFFVNPYKKKSSGDEATTLTGASGTIFNPGNVASKPKITITNSGSSGNNTITIGNKQMLFMAVTGTIVIDCEANIVTQSNGTLWTGAFVGDFLTIPTGSNAIAQTGTMAVTIEPRWRWV